MKCQKSQCYNYELCTNCKLCLKSLQCNFCKAPKVHIGKVKCTKSLKYNRYVIRKVQCTYISKKHWVKYVKFKEKCEDYEDLPSKYESNYE